MIKYLTWRDYIESLLLKKDIVLLLIIIITCTIINDILNEEIMSLDMFLYIEKKNAEKIAVQYINIYDIPFV